MAIANIADIASTVLMNGGRDFCLATIRVDLRRFLRDEFRAGFLDLRKDLLRDLVRMVYTP